MATPVIMPRQGQSVESCIFSEWLVQEGARVKKGDILFSYETDKAAFEGESPEDGILLATFAEPGEEIPVLRNIGVIGKKGENIDAFKPDSAEDTETIEKTGAGIAASKDIPAQDTSGPSGKAEIMGISPRARKTAAKLHISTPGITGSGPYGRILERDIIEKSKTIPRATPLAKSISYQDRIDLPESGSGTGGRVIASDMRKTVDTGIPGDFEEKKISNIRKIIAENMHASLRNTAQLTLHTSADARNIKSARSVIKSLIEKNNGVNITINDMVCYAVVQALLKHRDMNVHFLGDHIRYFRNVHLGFAVDSDRGLIVPTLKNANHLKPEGLSEQLKELAAMSRNGKIDPELLKGATFTVTNLGAFDIEMFTPVLNPPQAGILGVNTITLQPVELAGGSFGFIPKIGLSLTFDHRAIDGAPAAAFLQEVKRQIETFKIE